MSKILKGAAELLLNLHGAVLNTVSLPEMPDPATASAGHRAKAMNFIAAQEPKGLAFGGIPGRLWAGALFTSTETPVRLDASPLVNAGTHESPIWRWERSPVLYLGDPAPLFIPAAFREDEESAKLLWRPALWGNLPTEIEPKVLQMFRRLGHLIMKRAKSLWPLPACTREIVASAPDNLDRWLLFCVLASLYQTPPRPFDFRIRAHIEGMLEPIDAGIADIQACHPTPSVRRLRSSEGLMAALGLPERTPPLRSDASWHLVAETTANFELAAHAAVLDLIRGPVSGDAPKDLMKLRDAVEHFQRSDRTLRSMIGRGELRDYRAPGHSRTAPIWLSRGEVERALRTPAIAE